MVPARARSTWSVAIPVALVLTVALAGCAPVGFLTLRPDEATISPCPTPTTIPVEQLRSTTGPACTPSGSDLVFPSGVTVTIDDDPGAGGFESSDDPVRYSWIDVGNDGIVAGQATKACTQHEVWGTPDGVRKVRDAFGTDWPCT